VLRSPVRELDAYECACDCSRNDYLDVADIYEVNCRYILVMDIIDESNFNFLIEFYIYNIYTQIYHKVLFLN